MNEWLAAAPQATVAQGVIGCMVSLNDLADREPRPLADGEVLDIGGHRMRWIDTPHVPHAWEAGLLFDETTTHALLRRPLRQVRRVRRLHDDDIAGPAIEATRGQLRVVVAPPIDRGTLRRPRRPRHRHDRADALVGVHGRLRQGPP